ncbi:ABC transporter ATP-binding protein [Pseudorhodoplanes sinuspersici]|uniref:ABC transporter ATP-binding protein n=1 Tax=Pseudorhodoplanes sinuspersici TaxID=1235591 RepID=A0A1W6ZTK6_9HYPH|nr:ABC transporter ATP-binding protein [Pseudorhodoplanes sinuspersici]ARQ00680.1 ABC transporter ATP-binding protein [Pseudorhodoplanes sinuspersici]RKE72286.1 ATP-binding cassette subfamily B protein [Pseudorhodoplanes sinuspersici]
MAPKAPADSESSYQLIRRLVTEYGAKHWKRYAVAFALMALSAGTTALIAYLMGTIVNKAYVDRSFQAIVIIGLITIVIFCARGLATYFQAVIMSRIGNAIIAENQRRLFDRLMNQNLGFFAERHSSEFLHRLSTGANSATQVLRLLVTSVGRDALSLIGLATVMVIQDPVMSLSALIIAPPAMWMIRKLVKRIRAVAKAQFTGGTRLFQTLQETIQGIRTVKAFTLEDRLRHRYYENVAAVEYEANKMARVSNRSSPTMEALAGVAIAAGVIYGGYRTIEMNATPGEFFSFITAFLLAYEPAKRLARLQIELNAGLVGVRQLFDIIDAPSTEAADVDKPKLVMDKGRVEFKDVRFGYRENEPVLRGLSLVAQAGQMTALVGPSGGGKSTILNLILRLYEPQSGSITIDGQTITAVSRHSLRQQIAYVGQDVFLFHGTIRDNIGFGKEGATEDEIIAAAKAANAHDFIMSFPHGYDTHTGEQGLQLSGGQRQRIAVARALIKDAKLILLDEATAALDSESERLVQDAIAHLTQDRTTIVIAHRLHTVAHADRIFVIEEGVVAEDGRHEELLRKGGRYASFYRLQLQNQDEPELVAATA